MNEIEEIAREISKATPADLPTLLRRARQELDRIERELDAPAGKIVTIDELRLKGDHS